MSLGYILQEIAADTGISLDDSDERSMLVSRVNRAAKELYETKGLYGSIFEDVFDIGVEANQISLPWYVKNVLGMRYYDGRHAVELEDMVGRYFHSLNTEIWYLKHRTKEKSCLSRDIDNQSVLTFTIIIPETSVINFTIIGQTDIGSERRETVTLAAGALTVSSLGLYKDIKTIRKDRITENDVVISDVDGNELGVIPNHLLRSDYNIIQILDSTTPPNNTNMDALEVLYEKPFSPFVNDEDDFVYGDGYDDAIIWKYFEHRSKTSEEALGYQIKVDQLIKAIWIKVKQGVTLKMNFKKGPYFNPPYSDVGYSHRYPNY